MEARPGQMANVPGRRKSVLEIPDGPGSHPGDSNIVPPTLKTPPPDGVSRK